MPTAAVKTRPKSFFQIVIQGLILVLSALTLTACSRYLFTVNEQVWYQPAPLFLDFKVADPALQNCLDQAVVDAKASRAEQVTTLHCSYAGIRSLEGIDQFPRLQELDLQHNAIADPTPLLGLSHLAKLDLSHNQLGFAAALLSLPALSYLDLRNNPPLYCSGLQKAAAHYQGELKLPEQCDRASPTPQETTPPTK